MTDIKVRGIRAQGWLYGYIILLFLSLPVALPAWNGFLRDRIGPFITIEQIHLAQYGVLGSLAGVFGWSKGGGCRAGLSPFVLVLLVGVLDEIIQWLLPGRFFNLSDIGLNWLGGLAGLVVSRIIIGVRPR